MTSPKPSRRTPDRMFTREELAREFEDTLSVPHEVSMLTPVSFRLRPGGLRPDDPGYSVIVERGAFRMRAQVTLDALGGRIRTAILAGMKTNPAAADRASAVIRSVGWRPELRITDYDFRIGAVDEVASTREADDVLASCVSVASALSEFVLSQLVVTRKLETRPAAPREIGGLAEQSAVWEYDPSERDRATLEHRMLENWLISRVQSVGLTPLDAVHGPRFDLAWMVGETMVICEVKTTSGEEVKQLRLGLGQVLHYQAQAARNVPGGVRAALLVESKPGDDLWLDLCEELGIVLFWPDDEPLPPSLTTER